MQNDEIEINVAEEKDAKELTNLYRKLYAGDEEQEFFKSEPIRAISTLAQRFLLQDCRARSLNSCELFSTSTSKTKVLV
ncbi:MAG: hypothetical protein RXO35_00900 [Candidatus Micrarchaeota archaeon]